MKPQYGKVTLWAVAVYFLITEMSDMVRKGIDPVIQSWMTQSGFLLSLSSFLLFTSYSVGAYGILFRLRTKSLNSRVAALALFVLLIMAIRCFVEEVLYFHVFGFDNYYPGVSWGSYFFDNLYYAIVFSSVGIIYYYVQFAQHKEHQRQELILQNKKTELAFLRSQLNPHFLFNTLNNIYTLVYQKSDRALDAMDKLTSLLRYTLYEAAEKVPLEKELRYMEDFIALQRLRYDYEIPLRLTIDESARTLVIPPFLFLAFVENAFKHGDLKNSSRPVTISFSTDEETFVFFSENKIRPQQKDQTGGIGLGNIIKRLELLFPDQHLLDIRMTGDQFRVRLEIPLHLCRP
jgi:two-component system LytT family sensor kinase